MRSFIPNAAMVHTHSFGVTQDAGANFSGPEDWKSTDPIVLIDDEVVRISAIPFRPRSSKNTMVSSNVPNLIWLVK